MEGPDGEVEEIEQYYPAIERVLGVLKSRLNIDCDRLHRKPIELEHTQLAVPSIDDNLSYSSKIKKLDICQRARFIADKVESLDIHMRMLHQSFDSNSKSTINDDCKQTIVQHSFNTWKGQVVRDQLILRELFHRSIWLSSADFYRATYTREMRVRCIRRFGKPRLACLLHSWNLKRKTLVAWIKSVCSQRKKIS